MLLDASDTRDRFHGVHAKSFVVASLFIFHPLKSYLFYFLLGVKVHAYMVCECTQWAGPFLCLFIASLWGKLIVWLFGWWCTTFLCYFWQDFDIDAFQTFIESSSVPIVTTFNKDPNNHQYITKFFNNAHAKVRNAILLITSAFFPLKMGLQCLSYKAFTLSCR